LSIFSTRTEKEGFKGFSLEKMKIKGGLGAHIGLISLIFSIRDLKGGIVGDFTSGEKKTGKMKPA
jgi:hypothetical protein